MRKKQWSLFCLILLLFSLTGCGGGDTEDPFNFSGVEPKSIDPWTYLKDMSITTSTAIRDFASSSSELFITIGIIGIVFSIFYMALRIFFSGNPKTRSEIKDEILLKGMIAIMLFSIPFWLGLFKMFAEILV